MYYIESRFESVLDFLIIILSCAVLYLFLITLPIIRSNVSNTVRSNMSPNVDLIIHRNIPSIINIVRSGRLLK